MISGPRTARRSRRPGAWAGSALLLLAVLPGCQSDPPQHGLVVTENPAMAARSPAPSDLLDQRYPLGSRVILINTEANAQAAHVLSKGLAAAGDIVVSTPGDRVLFAGKATASSPWQIYEAHPGGGSPRQLTSLPGGAMNPAVLPRGDIVFSSPVPSIGPTASRQEAPALYRQAPGGRPQRLTFSGVSATDPTVLQDGRILFVSVRPGSCGPGPELALFTINNDGTELRAFAIDHDGLTSLRKPRETTDGRVVFLAGTSETPGQLHAESVRKARPFAGRTPVPGPEAGRCTSAEPGEDAMWICSPASGPGSGASAAAGVYRLARSEPAPARLFYHEQGWDCVEALTAKPRRTPMGHMSAIQPDKQTGTLLCLNANLTRSGSNAVMQATKAARVRVLASGANGDPRVLGEAPVQDDGSFMVEAPANTALGFQTLDAAGTVLQTLPPFLWIRPGENRSCVGCHEPGYRSPKNSRPRAVNAPITIIRAAPSNSHGSATQGNVAPGAVAALPRP